MKITTDSPDLLILDDRPIFLGIALTGFILLFVGIGFAMLLDGIAWGLIFVVVGGGMGLGAFWAFVRRVQLVFHRPEGYVEFRRRNIFTATRVRHLLAEIDRAEIEQTSSSDGGPMQRVVLVIERGQSVGRHPITLAYSNATSHQRTADAINRWLAAARAPGAA